MYFQELYEKAELIAQKTEQAIQIMFRLRDKKLDALIKIVEDINRVIGQKRHEIYKKYELKLFNLVLGEIPDDAKRELKELNEEVIRKLERKHFNTIVNRIEWQLKILSIFFHGNNDLIGLYNQEIVPLLHVVEDKRNNFLSRAQKRELKSALFAIKALMESANGQIQDLENTLKSQIKLAIEPSGDFSRDFLASISKENEIFNTATHAYGYHIAKLHELRQKVKVIGRTAISSIAQSVRSANFKLRYNKKMMAGPVAAGVIYGVKEGNFIKGIVTSIISMVGLYTFLLGLSIKENSKIEYNKKINEIIEIALKRPKRENKYGIIKFP